MDAQAIGPVERTSTQVSRETYSPESKVPSGGSTKGTQTDTVSLSQRGQGAVSQQVENHGGKGTGSELRKIDMTDDNQVIIKIVDGQPPKVVRQIPKEEEVRLKEAIQENVDNLIDSESSENAGDNV